jgi:hypothetical protein
VYWIGVFRKLKFPFDKECSGVLETKNIFFPLSLFLSFSLSLPSTFSLSLSLSLSHMNWTGGERRILIRDKSRIASKTKAIGGILQTTIAKYIQTNRQGGGAFLPQSVSTGDNGSPRQSNSKTESSVGKKHLRNAGVSLDLLDLQSEVLRKLSKVPLKLKGKKTLKTTANVKAKAALESK